MSNYPTMRPDIYHIDIHTHHTMIYVYVHIPIDTYLCVGPHMYIHLHG